MDRSNEIFSVIYYYCDYLKKKKTFKFSNYFELLVTVVDCRLRHTKCYVYHNNILNYNILYAHAWYLSQ